MGACKSENTFAAQDLFHRDNYHFTPVFGSRWGALFRKYSSAVRPPPEGQRFSGHRLPYREVAESASMWGGQDFHLVHIPKGSLTELRTPQELIANTWLMHGLGMTRPNPVHHCLLATTSPHFSGHL